MATAIMYFDGTYYPKKLGGYAAWGVWIEGLGPGGVGLCGCLKKSRPKSVAVAEYTALVRGLEYLVQRGVRTCEIRGDNQSIIKQMLGMSRVKASTVVSLWSKAVDLSRRLTNVVFRWIPRKDNARADLWSRFGLYCLFKKRAREVLAKWDIQVKSNMYYFHKENQSYTVTRQQDGKFHCSCESYRASPIGVCKHVAAAWFLAGE